MSKIPSSTMNTNTTYPTTMLSPNNSTHITSATPRQGPNIQLSALAVVGIGLVAVIIVSFAVVGYLYLYKKGVLSCNTCKKYARIRRRTTSMSSQMTDNDPTFVVGQPNPVRRDQELFSIGDQDGDDHDGRPGTFRRRGTEDDYFYDEIFERSAFVDESVSRANKQLSVEQHEDMERGILEELDAAVPDLEFRKSSHKY